MKVMGCEKVKDHALIRNFIAHILSKLVWAGSITFSTRVLSASAGSYRVYPPTKKKGFGVGMLA